MLKTQKAERIGLGMSSSSIRGVGGWEVEWEVEWGVEAEGGADFPSAEVALPCPMQCNLVCANNHFKFNAPIRGHLFGWEENQSDDDD